MDSVPTPIEQAAQLLRELPILRTKLARALFCSPETCETVLAEVIKFLTLASECTDTQITPSVKVDLAWHEFLLFTRRYFDFCERNYGKMIHHEPSDNRLKNSAQYAETLRCYRKRFGQPPREYWAADRQTSQPAVDVDQDHDGSRSAHCGNCESDS